MSSVDQKYKEALRLYAETSKTAAQIARECNVGAAGFRAYLYRHHRYLLLARYGMEGEESSVKLRPKRGQRPFAHRKYKQAVEACDNLAYISLNVSEIARMCGVSATALGNFLRLHYPDVLERREKAKMRLGIADNAKRGVRKQSKETYARAVEMYRTTDMTIPEVAEACDVSLGGLSQHLRFYHKDVIEKRFAEREQARKGKKRIGKISGNGRKHVPDKETVEKYREALELYRGTDMIVKDIVRQTGVPMEGFRYYLRTWHRDLMLERRGAEAATCAPEDIDLGKTKRYLKSTSAKYARAIASLKADARPVASVAAEFGLNPETFRMYLKEHEPELARRQGMIKTAEGRTVSLQATEKYAEAIRLYETTVEDLKSIAGRLGLVYNSLGGYVRRNCPEAKKRHEAVVDSMKKRKTDGGENGS